MSAETAHTKKRDRRNYMARLRKDPAYREKGAAIMRAWRKKNRAAYMLTQRKYGAKRKKSNICVVHGCGELACRGGKFIHCRKHQLTNKKTEPEKFRIYALVSANLHKATGLRPSVIPRELYWMLHLIKTGEDQVNGCKNNSE